MAPVLQCCTSCRAAFRTDFDRCPIDGGVVTPTSSDPLIGLTIGEHYVIEALLGTGAMGRVYRAHHSRLVNKHYAVKVLYGDLAASAAMRMRFAHEAELASKLEHPNIVGVIDFGRTESGLMYLVMELVDGPSLGWLVARGAMPTARVLRIAHQLCDGLAHAHERGLVHRDFKPDNILVVGEPGTETARIADFGLAISTGEEEARLTTSGVVCTPAYAAPEQLTGAAIDHRADLYALGVTLFEMLTGSLPFSGDHAQVITSKVTDGVPSVRDRCPTVSPQLASTIQWLMQREPEARPPSARDVRAALDGMCFAPTITFHPPVIAQDRRGTRWYGLAAVIGIATASLVGVQWFENPAVTASSAEVTASVAVDEPSISYAGTSAEPIVPSAVEPETLEPDDEPVAPPPPPPPRARHRAQPMVVAQQAPAPEPSPVSATLPEPAPEPPAPAPPVASATPAPRIESTAPVADAPPSPPPAPHVAPVPARPRTARIASLDVGGPLAHSVLSRAVQRVLPAISKCNAGKTVKVSFAVDETRRPVDLQVGGNNACVATALSFLRTDIAPDVGEVTVMLEIVFDG